METARALLPLDEPRSISFVNGGKTYTYKFNRITPSDWKQCINSFVIDSELTKRSAAETERTERFDFMSPLVALAKHCIASVEGYQLTDGRSIMEIPTWRERLPLGDLKHVASQLQNVGQCGDQRCAFDPDFDVVRMEALWSSDVPGEMRKYFPLVHYFKPMTIEQQCRVLRSRSQVITVGGSRSGRTIFPLQHALFIELYDELVVRVEGYACGGMEIQTADLARSEMDSWHKITAITLLTKDPEEQA